MNPFSGLPERNRGCGRSVIDSLYGSAIRDLICRQLLDPVQKFSDSAVRGILDRRADTHAACCSAGGLILRDGLPGAAVKER